MKHLLKIIVFVFAFFLVFSSIAICAKKETPKPKTKQGIKLAVPEKSAVPVPKESPKDFIPPQGKYSVVTQCPVSNTKVVISKSTLASSYKGKDYFFCCPDCQRQFKENPEKYK